MKKILKNSIQCKNCKDVIVSEYDHDMKFCKCGKVAVDGGKSYLRRTYENSTDDYVELSEFEDIKDNLKKDT